MTREIEMTEKARGKVRLSRRGLGAIVTALALAAVGLTAIGTATAAPNPINTVQPAVTGAAQQGQTLTTTNGTWTNTGTPSPPAFTYRWQRCNPDASACANIIGATASTYTLGAADVGSTVRSDVIASDSLGSDDAPSDHTATVTAATSLAPANTTPPTITGTPAAGQTLSEVDGQWTGATPITFSYVWQACDATGGTCAPITGATSKTYLLTTAEVGKTLRVLVTAANANGTRATTTVPTAVITSAGPATLIKLSNGSTSIDASEVTGTARLILSKFKVQQTQPLRTRAPFRVTFTVTDTRGYVVRNALVYLIGLPYNRILTAPEQHTGQDGTVTFQLTPTRLQPLTTGARLVIFARARVQGDSLLAGASQRRLVEVVFGAPH
jgi:hypothetical protein